MPARHATHHHRQPAVDLYAPEVFADAPKPIPALVRELERLIDLKAQAFRERDQASAAVSPAQQKDEQAVARAYADGGTGDVDPTAHQDAARKEAAAAQSRLAGIITALSSAAGKLSEALAQHGDAWELDVLGRLSEAEGRLASLVEEAHAVYSELDVAASLVKLARAKGSTLQVAGWSGGQRLQRALTELEEARLYIGMDGEPLAPWEREEVGA